MRKRVIMIALLILSPLFLPGCATTDGTIVLDPQGESVEVTQEEVAMMSGGEQPYLLQTGDQLRLAFNLHDFREGEPNWEYKIEVGDNMEVRFSEKIGERDQYRIDVGDLVGISFLGNWTLNVTRTVRADGYLTFEHVGDVKAGGLTADELKAQLTDLYSKSGIIAGEPLITVTVDFTNPDRLGDMSRDVVVRPDGRVRLPRLTDDVQVVGLTVTEACKALQAEAAKVLRNEPVVGIVLFPYINNALNSMGGAFTIRPDGKITVPRLGEIQAAGYSVAELTDNLREQCEAFAQNKVDPAVDTLVCTGARVYVGGEVNMPGVYPLEGAPTALQALIMANGQNDQARMNSVLVIRRNPNGKPYVFKTNLHLALRGDTQNDLPLRAFDIVYIPKKLVSKANLFVKQYIDDIVPFDNSLGVSGSYYLNEQTVRTKSRNINYSTGVNLVPGFSQP